MIEWAVNDAADVINQSTSRPDVTLISFVGQRADEDRRAPTAYKIDFQKKYTEIKKKGLPSSVVE